MYVYSRNPRFCKLNIYTFIYCISYGSISLSGDNSCYIKFCAFIYNGQFKSGRWVKLMQEISDRKAVEEINMNYRYIESIHVKIMFNR